MFLNLASKETRRVQSFSCRHKVVDHASNHSKDTISEADDGPDLFPDKATAVHGWCLVSLLKNIQNSKLCLLLGRFVYI